MSVSAGAAEWCQSWDWWLGRAAAGTSAPTQQGPTAWQAYFFTEKRLWLDVIEVRITPVAGGAMELSAYSFCAGCAPCALVGCLFWSMLLFMIPFTDHGQNRVHLRTLRVMLEEAGLAIARKGT